MTYGKAVRVLFYLAVFCTAQGFLGPVRIQAAGELPPVVATRDLPEVAPLGKPVRVTIDLRSPQPEPIEVEPPPFVVDVTEVVPPGWIVHSVGQGGSSQNGIITWRHVAPPVVLTYEVENPGLSAGRFEGTFSAGGNGYPIRGDQAAGGTGMTKEGFITAWLLLNPLEEGGFADPGIFALRSEFLTDGAEKWEETVLPKAGDEIEVDFCGLAASDMPIPWLPPALPIRATWRRWIDRDDTIEFEEKLPPETDWFVVYGVVYVDNPFDGPITTSIGCASDDSIAVMINEKYVHAHSVERGFGPPGSIQDVVKGVRLRPGRNRLCVKVFEGGGKSGFRLRFQDEEGNPLYLPIALEPGELLLPLRVVRTLPLRCFPGETIEVAIDVQIVDPLPISEKITIHDIAPPGWQIIDPPVPHEPGNEIVWRDLPLDNYHLTYKVRVPLSTPSPPTQRGVWEGSWWTRGGLGPYATGGDDTVEIPERIPQGGKPCPEAVVTRLLPYACSSNEELSVQLEVEFLGAVETVVVEEHVPEGWRIVDPAGGEVQGDTIRWYVHGPQTIRYVVQSDDTVSDGVFHGTYCAPESPILGDTTVYRRMVRTPAGSMPRPWLVHSVSAAWSSVQYLGSGAEEGLSFNVWDMSRDVSSTHDQFTYLYQTVNPARPFTAIARIQCQRESGPAAKAGIMARAGVPVGEDWPFGPLCSLSPHVSVGIMSWGVVGTAWRESLRGETQAGSLVPLDPPLYVAMTARRAKSFFVIKTAFSLDGRNWKWLEEARLRPFDVTVGLATTSNSVRRIGGASYRGVVVAAVLFEPVAELTCNAEGEGVTLSWILPGPGELPGIRVYRSTPDSSDETLVAELPGSATSFHDTSVPGPGIYIYRVATSLRRYEISSTCTVGVQPELSVTCPFNDSSGAVVVQWDSGPYSAVRIWKRLAPEDPWGRPVVELPGTATQWCDGTGLSRWQQYRVEAYPLEGPAPLRGFCTADLRKEEIFLRGDPNIDGQADISDAVWILEYLFATSSVRPPCLNAADVNDSEQVDLADAVYLLMWLFAGGGPPEPPHPWCAHDPTPSSLRCPAYPLPLCPHCRALQQ